MARAPRVSLNPMKTPISLSALALCGLLLAGSGLAAGCSTIFASDVVAAQSRNRPGAVPATIATAPIYLDTSDISTQQQRYLLSWRAVFVGENPKGATLRILEEDFSTVKSPEAYPAQSDRPALHYEVKAELIVNGRSILLRESQEYYNLPAIRRDGRPRGVDDRAALVAWTAELLAKRASAHL